MKLSFLFSIVAGLFMFFALPAGIPSTVNAHCDTLGGPVVSAARESLRTGNANFMLIWVKREDEDKVLAEFKEALKRKKLSGGTGDDLKLFETLVRIHRAGEGADFTGIKADEALKPEVSAADKALANKDFSLLAPFIPENLRDRVHADLHTALTLSSYHMDDVEQGRNFVAAYVTYAHNVERAVKGLPLIDAGTVHSHTHDGQTAVAKTDTNPTGTGLVSLITALFGSGIALLRKVIG